MDVGTYVSLDVLVLDVESVLPNVDADDGDGVWWSCKGKVGDGHIWVMTYRSLDLG